MTRHFGIPSGARNPGGMGISRSAYRADTPREPNLKPPANAFPLWRSLTGRKSGLSHPPTVLDEIFGRQYPLPAQSIADEPPTEEVKLFAAGSFVTVFLSLCFFIPILAVGIILHFQ